MALDGFVFIVVTRQVDVCIITPFKIFQIITRQESVVREINFIVTLHISIFKSTIENKQTNKH